MSEAAFPLHIARALDLYTLAQLPAGFADRLVDRALGGYGARLPAMETTWRRPRMRRWQRAGTAATGIIVAGLLSATAAAMGLFGARIDVPVISALVARYYPEVKPLPAGRIPGPSNALVKAPSIDAAPAQSNVEPRAFDVPSPVPGQVAQEAQPVPRAVPTERANLVGEAERIAPPVTAIEVRQARIEAASERQEARIVPERSVAEPRVRAPVVPEPPLVREAPASVPATRPVPATREIEPVRTRAIVPPEVRPAARERIDPSPRAERVAPPTRTDTSERRREVPTRRIP